MSIVALNFPPLDHLAVELCERRISSREPLGIVRLFCDARCFEEARREEIHSDFVLFGGCLPCFLDI